MSELKNDIYLKAALGQPTPRTPVWMMRQAGRYLPEYRATRSKAGNFMSLCQNPELACEVTMQPLARYALDAAILFSDILTIPDALGLGLYFTEGEGPAFKQPCRTESEIKQLPALDPYKDLRYVMDAVSLIRKTLNGSVPLIGFSGSPWTLATYMVEGGPTKNFSKIKGLMFKEPQLAHLLLDKLADAVTVYLNAQIESGAQAVMIFDTWGGVLTQRDYHEFSLRYMHKIVDSLTRNVDGQRIPVTLFTKDGGQWLDSIANTGCDCVGVDWTLDLADARNKVKDAVALQGNMDPSILYATPERIEQEVETVLESFGVGHGHVFNLGHGIHPQIDPANVEAFINAVHKHSPRFHAEGQ